MNNQNNNYDYSNYDCNDAVWDNGIDAVDIDSIIRSLTEDLLNLDDIIFLDFPSNETLFEKKTL